MLLASWCQRWTRLRKRRRGGARGIRRRSRGVGWPYVWVTTGMDSLADVSESGVWLGGCEDEDQNCMEVVGELAGFVLWLLHWLFETIIATETQLIFSNGRRGTSPQQHLYFFFLIKKNTSPVSYRPTHNIFIKVQLNCSRSQYN
jgi:hypothetical protein